MDLKTLYYEVKGHIDNVDFSKLWNGFKPLKFALYNDNECFFNGNYIKKTDEFLANTSILYNGEWIAIWHVDCDVDSIILASKMIHEMFHGFQALNNESRFFDDIDALYNYKYTEDNLNLKLDENKLIYSLVNKFDINKFNEFLQIRKYRFNNYNYEFHYESCIEQIEGTANYVELSSLKQLSDILYKKELERINEEIINANKMFPIRTICYNTGALLLLLMNENNIEYEQEFSSVTFSEDMLNNIEEKKIKSNSNLKDLIDNYYLNADKIINNAIEKNEVVTEAKSNILAVNIYDAVYYKNYIISKYFVMYGSIENKKIEYGDFVIETKEYKMLTKIYRI